jgi:hypothetical protein
MKKNRTVVFIAISALLVMLVGCKSVPIDYATFDDVTLVNNVPESEQVPVGISAYINVTQFDDTPVNWHNEDESISGTYMYVKVPSGTHTLYFYDTQPLSIGFKQMFEYTFTFETGKKYVFTITESNPADFFGSRTVYILLEVDENGKRIYRNPLDRSLVAGRQR